MRENRIQIDGSRLSIVIGVTHPQTCLVLKGRLGSLRAAGFQVTVIASPGAMLRRTAVEEGVAAFAIPMRREIAPLADLLALIRWVRALRRIRPEVVEFSTPKAGLLGAIASRITGIPVRVYLLRGLKLERTTGPKRWLLLWAERLAASCAHVVVCNSESLRSEAAALGIARLEKLLLLGEGSSRGVDTGRFIPGDSWVRQALGLSNHVPVIGFVGRLTRDKGVPELLQAFESVAERVPSARLMLVGWFDESEDALDEEARSAIRRDSRIVCTGFVEDTAPYYRAMDVMVLPTWREGFPNSVLEASATGIPVVTTLSTGSRDAVVPEVTGLLVPPGYPDAIAEAVLTLLKNPDRRYRMGRAARTWVTENFSDGHVLGLTAALYKRLARESVPDVERETVTAGD